MFTGYIPGLRGYWGTLGNCFLFHILSWLFPASRAAASSDRGAGLPILLSDCSCHRLLPVDPTWQTPWEDKLRDLQHTSEDRGDHHPLFLPQGGGSTSYIEQSGTIWLCWKWGMGTEGLVLTPLQKKAGHFNLFLQKLPETLMPTHVAQQWHRKWPCSSSTCPSSHLSTLTDSRHQDNVQFHTHRASG